MTTHNLVSDEEPSATIRRNLRIQLREAIQIARAHGLSAAEIRWELGDMLHEVDDGPTTVSNQVLQPITRD